MKPIIIIIIRVACRPVTNSAFTLTPSVFLHPPSFILLRPPSFLLLPQVFGEAVERGVDSKFLIWRNTVNAVREGAHTYVGFTSLYYSVCSEICTLIHEKLHTEA